MNTVSFFSDRGKRESSESKRRLVYEARPEAKRVRRHKRQEYTAGRMEYRSCP